MQTSFATTTPFLQQNATQRSTALSLTASKPQLLSAAAFASRWLQFGSDGSAGCQQAVTAAGGHFSTPSISTVCAAGQLPDLRGVQLRNRTASRQQEHDLGYSMSGNHGYHEPVSKRQQQPGDHAGASSAGFFPGIPTAKSFCNRSLNTVTNIYSGASSNFNGIVLTRNPPVEGQLTCSSTTSSRRRWMKSPTVVLSPSLRTPAIPQHSSIHSTCTPTTDLADYNVKHNITSSFVYQLPFTDQERLRQERWLAAFEISGDAFHQSGLPYSVTQSEHHRRRRADLLPAGIA